MRTALLCVLAAYAAGLSGCGNSENSGPRQISIPENFHSSLGDPVAEARKAIAAGKFEALAPYYKFGAALGVHFPGVACRFGGIFGWSSKKFELPSPILHKPYTESDVEILKYIVAYNHEIFGSEAYPDPDLCRPVPLCLRDDNHPVRCQDPSSIQYADKPRHDDGSLGWAVRAHDILMVKKRLTDRDVANETMRGGYRPLDYALYDGSIDIARTLLLGGAWMYEYKKTEARLLVVEPTKYDAMVMALAGGHLESAKLLVETGMPWVSGDSKAYSLGFSGKKDFIDYLADSYPDHSKIIRTEAFIGAIDGRKTELVDQLISHADLNHIYSPEDFDSQQTALSEAWLEKDYELMSRLIKRGADPHIFLKYYDSVAVRIALSQKADLIESLLGPVGCGAETQLHDILIKARDFSKKYTPAELDRFSRYVGGNEGYEASKALRLMAPLVHDALIHVGCKPDWLPMAKSS